MQRITTPSKTNYEKYYNKYKQKYFAIVQNKSGTRTIFYNRDGEKKLIIELRESEKNESNIYGSNSR